ncbi:0f0ec2ea-78ae-4c6e-b54b-93035a80059e [Sclerotinia trifoliorum]|uniref:0f0ec2ea-78ae-4c6e-b54b-93035a80059e n=1 Tax=Sclerotinia trifoliorum TaxID=28548 RepID=A0A8H2VTE5_9HELO|nr:0f0ec2ea-78ae-4c6e-b54b-93035a80059e [Sclerotinia trifoliorum]
MSGILSKRQLARNEMALQELVKSPGNNVCADCQARNPGWASWSLGIFLCMRCAALHRKLGTHITKVKSLSMDSWSKDQVEHMKKVGNVVSNRIYNPQNTRPPIPIDADEADSAMERFIRQKYSNGPQVQRRNHTGSSSSDDHPPPLPPKNGAKFGFRSASSIFPLSSKAKKDNEDARAEFNDYNQPPSPPPRNNKHSRIFGTSLDATDDLESKMAKLRELGFRDEKRNTTVLKGLNGNLEKSIETLVRLGEGGSSARTASSINSSGPRTPASPPGLSFERPQATSPTTSSASNNPFDRLDNPVFPHVQSTQSTGSMVQAQRQMMGGNPYQNTTSTNPFGLMPSQSQLNLNQSFQNMSVSSPQPLFPHHTGGVPGPQPPAVQQLYQQSMAPPVPSLPQQYYQPVVYENQGRQSQSQQIDRNNMNTNPFMQQAPPPVVNTNLQSNPFMQQAATNQTLFASPVAQTPQQQYPSGNYNMGGQNPPPQMNPFLNQANMQQQQQQQQQQQALQPQYGYQQQPQSQYQQPQVQPQSSQYDQYRQQTYPMMPQPTGRLVDKRSILDLYNYPQLAPTQIQQQQQEPDPIQQQAPQATDMAQPNGQMSSGSNNPFMSNVAAAPNGGTNTSNGSGRQISRESMMIDGGGWQNGRHSPDAWGQISGRR